MEEALGHLDVEVRLWSKAAKKASKMLLRFSARMERLPAEFNAAIFSHLESLYEA
jgi:hypothetical protein